jgi:ribosomal protein S18 acetylase RimI-like enzyme
MSDSPRCREATKADLGEVLRLHALASLDDRRALSLSEAERIFERMASYPDYRLWVAVVGDRIVGTFALLVMDNLGHRGTPAGVIESVVVDPAWQRQGIGRMMMRHALDECRARGCYKAVLSSNVEREQAHAFYDALGFERHGYSFRVRF